MNAYLDFGARLQGCKSALHLAYNPTNFFIFSMLYQNSSMEDLYPYKDEIIFLLVLIVGFFFLLIRRRSDITPD